MYHIQGISEIFKKPIIHARLDTRPRKKIRVLERVLRRAMHIIRSETLGSRLANAKSLTKTSAKSLTESLGESREQVRWCYYEFHI